MILYLTLLMENNPMNNKYRQLTLFIIGHYNCNYKINDKKKLKYKYTVMILIKFGHFLKIEKNTGPILK